MAVRWASARPLLAREPLRLLRGAAGRAHALRVEVAAVAFVHELYQAGRGLASNDSAAADRNAERIADLERTLGFFSEQSVQQAAAALPSLPSILALSYVTLHLGATLLVRLALPAPPGGVRACPNDTPRSDGDRARRSRRIPDGAAASGGRRRRRHRRRPEL